MIDTIRKRGRLVVAVMLAAMLALTSIIIGGCASGGGDTKASVIKIGYVPWDEDIAASYLWKQVLEEEGYSVELTQLDVAPVFQGVSSGDLDLFLDVWLPDVHADYWAQYSDSLEDLGPWYYDVLTTWAVPEYVDIDSIEDLVGRENEFDGRVVGIEPGAGLMRLSRENVLPDYGLEGYEVLEGSTSTMLAELGRSIKDEEPIIVTLWHPHWAYSVFPIKDLEDPKGSLGAKGEIRSVARPGFTEEFADVAKWISTFEMNDEQLGSLEDIMMNKYSAGEEEKAVEEWLSDENNRSLVNSWLGK